MLEEKLRQDVEAVARISAVPMILDIISRTTEMGFTAVARVTPDRWVTCASLDKIGFGLQPGDELDVKTTISHDPHSWTDVIVIDDVENDGTYRDHLAPCKYGFRSFISVPIILADGAFFGRLLAIDPEPRRLNTPETVGTLKLFARLIARELETSEALAQTRRDLEAEKKLAAIREEFVAVLGHDLRNPIASFLSGTRLLKRTRLDEQARQTVALMQSTAVRMNLLVDNLLDFARARLGGGFRIEPSPDAPLRQELEQVVAELRTISDHEIRLELDIPEQVESDAVRMGQLLSNLLGNATKHGDRSAPILVRATIRNNVFELSVTNAGEPIPQEIIRSLFRPFTRGENTSEHNSLGLGLYIASEVAKAHGGELSVTSGPEDTCFTMTMPLPRGGPVIDSQGRCARTSAEGAQVAPGEA